MLKKCFGLLLCVGILIAVCTVAPVSAATADDTALESFVSGMGIMAGYPDGSFGFDNYVSRGEFSKIAVAASKYRNSVASSITVSPFSDVPYSHWAAPYVRVASVNGYVNGYVDATFKPDNPVYCEEAVNVALKMLGYTSEDFGSAWPYGQMGLAANLNLTDGIDASVGQYMTRRDVARLMYNLMNTKKKGSNEKYIADLDCTFAEDVVVLSTDGAQVVTDSGKYNIYKTFDSSFVGKQGDMIVKDGNIMVAFVPDSANVEKYAVYSKVDGAVVTYRNGALSQLEISDSDTAYYNSAKTTYGAVKSSIAMGDVIYVKKNASGNIEYVTIESGSLKGPYTVLTSQWYNAFGSTDGATVMRDGVKVSIDDVKTYDVAYYSPDLNIIFTYSKKVTGVYQSASPNTDNPESITVSGTEYKLESANAFNAVSSSGSFRPGDTVTLLIGRSGAVADVVSPNNSSYSVVGYLIGSGNKEFTNINGDSYTSNYITVVTVSGEESEYVTNKKYDDKVGQVVTVKFTDGVATATPVSKTAGVYGTVSYSGKKIGNTKISDSVNIIDVVKSDDGTVGGWASVFLQRIDGLELKENDILYYEKNSSGEVISLILDDVTGDAYEYGIVTKAETRTGKNSYSGSYTVDVNGKEYNHSISAIYNGISTGQPVKVVMRNGNISTISALPMLSQTVTDITSTTVTAGGTVYTVSPDVTVYTRTSDYQYMTTPFSEAEEHAKGSVKVFFDKSPSKGGQVRLIVLR